MIPAGAVWQAVLLANDCPLDRVARIRHLRSKGYAFQPARDVVRWYESEVAQLWASRVKETVR